MITTSAKTTSANGTSANGTPAGRRIGFACLAGAMVLVGTTVIASKTIAGGDGPGGMGPFTATALRFALAFPLFLLLMRWQRVRLPRPGWRDLGLLVVQAGAGSVGYTTLLISGLARTSAADAGVVIGTLPVVTGAIAVMVLGERPGRRLLVAIALAAAGMMTVAAGGADGRGAGDDGTSSLAGNLLVLGAVVCEGVFILLNKRLRTPIAPLALSTMMTGLGFIAAGLPALILERPWAAVPETAALLGVAWYALVPTVIGFVLWYAGAARVSGAEAAPFTALAPVSAVALAALVLGEAVSLPQILGVACVLAALAALQLPKLQLPKLQLPNWASWRRR
ncbi:DMT family transporter [Tistrella mobilis]|uniref:DMT family transporter n=1 Tax=Tistrella mobilis TaxID=171437 RepID=UPI0035566263